MAKTLDDLYNLISSNIKNNRGSGMFGGGGNTQHHNAPAGGGGAGGGHGANFSSLVPPSLNPLNLALNATSTAAGAAVDGLTKFGPAITSGLDTWRQFTKAGMGWSNDVVGMTAAAYESRMGLQEFAQMVIKAGGDLNGLGGNATRGAEAFAKLSKELFESTEYSVDGLKQLGYSNQELNQLLITQMSFMRSSQKMDKTSQEESIKSAHALAEQMDLMAKLTGKSREEQMENMKKASADMQVESKFRLIGIQQGAEAEKKARDAFAKEYNEAALRGQGQMFKEVFATGSVLTKESATQAAMYQEQGKNTMAAAKAVAMGDAEAARAANQKAWEASIKDSKDASKLMIGTLGEVGGVATKTVHDNMAATRGLHDSVQSLRNEAEWKNKSERELFEEAKRRTQEAQVGKDKDGKDVSGTTKAMVNLESRVQDVTSAMAGAVARLNREVSPAISEFAAKFTSSVQNFKQADGTYKTQSVSSYIDGGLQGGIDKAFGRGTQAAQPDMNPRIKASSSTVIEDLGNMAGTMAKGFADVVNAINGLKEGQFVGPKREMGSIGMTGKAFEDWGKGTLVELHGKEGVYRPEDIAMLAKNFRADGVASAMVELKNIIPTAAQTSNYSAHDSSSAVVSDAIKTVNPTKITADNVVMDQTGRPTFKQMQKEIASIPASVEQKQKADADRKKADDAAQSKQIATQNAKTEEKSAPKTIGNQKEASLTDVVDRLERLNRTMNQFVEQHEDLGQRQIRATKGVGSDNVYKKV